MNEAEEIRKLTAHEIAAMWMFGEEYADLGIGAIAYWMGLSTLDKNNIKRMVKEIAAALEQEDI